MHEITIPIEHIHNRDQSITMDEHKIHNQESDFMMHALIIKLCRYVDY
jgi:hypothetical protein